MKRKQKKREKYLKGFHGLGVSITNVKFSISTAGYMRKRDKYRQIFGEKPKFLFVKIECGENGKKGCKT
jgi:hypothetical protein